MEDATPMMKQYLAIKRDNKDSILFFRLGDFYEMFFDDAIEATRILHITLTAREQRGKKIPMCGVPHFTSESYISKLVRAGHKVAICEQVGDPKQTRGIVKREVVKVVTATEASAARSGATGAPAMEFALRNRGKKSVEIDLDSPSAQADLRSLLSDADILIEALDRSLAAL